MQDHGSNSELDPFGFQTASAFTMSIPFLPSLLIAPSGIFQKYSFNFKGRKKYYVDFLDI